MAGNRDVVQRSLKENSISSVVYYPRPLHIQKALGFLGCREGEFPCAEDAARGVLSLPMYPELDETSIEKIAEVIRRVAE